MVNGQWSMVNGQWPMVNGQWSILTPTLRSGWVHVVRCLRRQTTPAKVKNKAAGGQWPMANGQWSMVNGQWSMVNGQWPMANGQWPMAEIKPDLLLENEENTCPAASRHRGNATEMRPRLSRLSCQNEASKHSKALAKHKAAAQTTPSGRDGPNSATQWSMVNGQWPMVNGQWSMANGQWPMAKF